MWPIQREAKPPPEHFRGATAPIAPPPLQALYCTQGWGVTQPIVCRGEGGSGPPTVHREHRVIPRLSATNTVALFLFLPSVAKAQGKRLLDMPS